MESACSTDQPPVWHTGPVPKNTPKSQSGEFRYSTEEEAQLAIRTYKDSDKNRNVCIKILKNMIV
jgi:hypothetical protein